MIFVFRVEGFAVLVVFVYRPEVKITNFEFNAFQTALNPKPYRRKLEFVQFLVLPQLSLQETADVNVAWQTSEPV